MACLARSPERLVSELDAPHVLHVCCGWQHNTGHAQLLQQALQSRQRRSTDGRGSLGRQALNAACLAPRHPQRHWPAQNAAQAPPTWCSLRQCLLRWYVSRVASRGTSQKWRPKSRKTAALSMTLRGWLLSSYFPHSTSTLYLPADTKGRHAFGRAIMDWGAAPASACSIQRRSGGPSPTRQRQRAMSALSRTHCSLPHPPRQLPAPCSEQDR
jgi:hypothetical protein